MKTTHPQNRLLPDSLNCLKPKMVQEMIRLGNRGDGGYVAPSFALQNVDGLLSFGISDDWSFEQDLARLNHDITIHAYDHSISEGHFRREWAKELRRLLRLKGSVKDFNMKLAKHVSYGKFFRGQFIHFRERIFNRKDTPNDATIDDVFSRIGDKNDLIVKMDIEGGEYRVIADLLKYERRIRLMLIEFHDTEPLRDTFLGNIRSITEYYDIVHIHGNNCSGVAKDGLPDVLEVTFLNKRLCKATTYRDRLPVVGLDFPNNPARDDFELLFA